jgi:hypothetical protein
MSNVGRNLALRGTPQAFPATIQIGGETICEGTMLWLSKDLDLRKEIGIILCKGAYILKRIDTSAKNAIMTLEMFVTESEKPKHDLSIMLLNHFEKMT